MPPVIPHVYTGVESIYPLLARMAATAAETPSKRQRRATSTAHPSADVSDTRIASVIVVVFLLVLSRMKDVDVSPDEYEEWVSKAMNAVLEASPTQDITIEELRPTIEPTLAMAREEGWLQMQWFESVKPVGNEDEMEGNIDADGNEDMILCLYEKVARVRNRWRCNLRDGVASIDGRDYVFSRLNAELEW